MPRFRSLMFRGSGVLAKRAPLRLVAHVLSHVSEPQARSSIKATKTVQLGSSVCGVSFSRIFSGSRNFYYWT
jgi:hypothetical protein